VNLFDISRFSKHDLPIPDKHKVRPRLTSVPNYNHFKNLMWLKAFITLFSFFERLSLKTLYFREVIEVIIIFWFIDDFMLNLYAININL